MSLYPVVRALARSCHPLPSVAVSALSAGLAALADLPFGTGILVTAAVFTGQLSIGWSNDYLDAERDRAADRTDKPVAAGAVAPRVAGMAALVALTLTLALSAALGWPGGAAALVIGVSWTKPVRPALDRTIANAKRDGVRVTDVPHGVANAGALRQGKRGGSLRFLHGRGGARAVDVPLRYEVEINKSHDDGVRYATLCHELAHLYLGHLGTPDAKQWPDRSGVSTVVAELEAETVAFIVARRLDSQVKFPPYLRKVLEGTQRQMPPLALSLMLKAAQLIEDMGAKSLKPRSQLSAANA